MKITKYFLRGVMTRKGINVLWGTSFFPGDATAFQSNKKYIFRRESF